MSGHLELSVAGWWAGVLHPMETPDHLITLLLVGLLGGLAVKAGRSSWALPATFMTGLLVFGAIGLALDRTLHVSVVVIALSVAMGVLMFVHPQHTGRVAVAVVLASGALHGLAHGSDGADHVRSVGYLSGFVFTGTVVMAVGAIVGAAIGRAQHARRPAVARSRSGAMDDAALV